MSHSLQSAQNEQPTSLSLTCQTRAISFNPNDLLHSPQRHSAGINGSFELHLTDNEGNSDIDDKCHMRQAPPTSHQSLAHHLSEDCSEDDLIDLEEEEAQFDQHVEAIEASLNLITSHSNNVGQDSLCIEVSKEVDVVPLSSPIHLIGQSTVQLAPLKLNSDRCVERVTYDSLSDLAKKAKLHRMQSHSSDSSTCSSPTKQSNNQSTQQSNAQSLVASTIIAHPSLSQAFQSVIQPITINPITRLNQDDVITGIAPLHVDLDTGKLQRMRREEQSINQLDEVVLANENLETIWYEDEISDVSSYNSQSSSDDEISRQFDREVSGITSRTLSINQSITAQPKLPLPIPSVSSTQSINRSISQSNPVQSAIRGSMVAAEFSYHVSQSHLLPATSLDDIKPSIKQSTKSGHISITVGPHPVKEFDVTVVSSRSSSTCSDETRNCASDACRASQYLAIAHFFSSFVSNGSWFIALISLMQIINNQSMFASSLYGAGHAVARVCSVPIIRWMQNKTFVVSSNRSVTFTSSIFFGVIIQHMLISVCMFLLYLMSIDNQYNQSNNQTFMLIGVICAGALATFGEMIAGNSAYQDWSRALFTLPSDTGLEPRSISRSVNQHFAAEEDEQQHVLRLRRTDLAASVLGPVAVAILLCSTGQSDSLAVAGGCSASILTIVLSLLVVSNRRLHSIKSQLLAVNDQDQLDTKQTAMSPFHRPASQTSLSRPSLLTFLSNSLLSLSMLSFTTSIIVYLAAMHISTVAIVSGVVLQRLVISLPRAMIESINQLIARRMSVELASSMAIWMKCVALAPLVIIFCIGNIEPSSTFLVPLFCCLIISSLWDGCFNCLEQAANAKDGEHLSHSIYALNLLDDPGHPLYLRCLVGICIVGSSTLTAIFSDPSLIFLPVLISFGLAVVAAVMLTVRAKRSPAYQSIKAAETELMVLQNLGTVSEEPESTHKMEDELMQAA